MHHLLSVYSGALKTFGLWTLIIFINEMTTVLLFFSCSPFQSSVACKIITPRCLRDTRRRMVLKKTIDMFGRWMNQLAFWRARVNFPANKQIKNKQTNFLPLEKKTNKQTKKQDTRTIDNVWGMDWSGTCVFSIDRILACLRLIACRRVLGSFTSQNKYLWFSLPHSQSPRFVP